MADIAFLLVGGLPPPSWAWRARLVSYSLGPSTRSVWPWPEFLIWADGGREEKCQGGRDYQRSKYKGLGPLLPVMSFWSLSFRDPFSRTVCNPGLALSSSLAWPHLLNTAHTLTQADTNSHTQLQRSAHATRRHMAWCLDILALLRQHKNTVEPLSTHKEYMAPEHLRFHMHTCS